MYRIVRTTFAALAAFAASHGPAFAQAPDFQSWLEGFRAEARAAGVSDAVINEAFDGLTPNERVFELNDNQPEFSKMIWDYLDTAVSERRIENGRAALAENRIILSLIEEAYGVDAETIVAIWGLESAYGANLGGHDAIQALATLAYDGRRTGYGRTQLIGALKIIENGFAARDQLKSSWAGAMGHTQFIPTTYLSYAVDHDQDGRRDIWSNLGDVFASTANYLAVSGYARDGGWGTEVRLPGDFDYALAGAGRKALAEWASLGASAMRGDLLGQYDPNRRARLVIPAGAKGPAFLVFDNFGSILKYNNSTAYALAVSLLAEEVAGRNGQVATLWPREDRALSLTERKELQQALSDRGFNPGPVDGIIGAGTRKALRAWQKATGRPADGYASAAVLNALKS
ncbi:MAG: lytic murein transglycosylase [Pseudomonadota bacterium]